jgi:Mg2+ and Co2+ transporter CorA
MELDEFEIRSKGYTEEIAKQLEIIQRLTVQLMTQIEELSKVMQDLSELIEDFINQQVV